MLIKRREFIQVGSLATTALMLPKFLKAFEGSMMVPSGNKVMVILQLSGGNDGLNTLVPIVNYSDYLGMRSNIAIPLDKVLPLSGYSKAGLHPSMTGMQKMYNEEKLSVL